MVQNLLVFSHLRWNFVFQRPQHLMMRMAKHFRVIFFEEPLSGSPQEFLETLQPLPNLTVCKPHCASKATGFHDDHIPTLQRMLRAFMSRERIDRYCLWLYSPMALPLMQDLQSEASVYDCMDELSAFRNAPRQMLQRENALLKSVDLVFTGGPSLYRAKCNRHPAVYCFPSSVDVEHYRRGRDRTFDHELQRHLPSPRLGYFGVIDERLDLPLIASLADQRPDWQIVMVGPHVKIDAQCLPRNANIHYFGQQDYADLPRFVAGWDVCLQPFALNEATRFISPTKTLEYMAAEKPIVSTPVADVAEPYGHIVHVAGDAAEFIQACESALSRNDGGDWERRLQAARAVLAATSWDDTVDRMRDLLQTASDKLAPKTDRQGIASTGAPTSMSHRSAPLAGKSLDADDYSTIVLGAGPTGLSAAHHLGEGSLLLEQNATVGGWCRSIVDNGFTFDYAGHIMFSNDAYVQRLYGKLLGDNVHWQDREAWVYSKGVHTRYPFQSALHGLPPEVIKECLVGAIEARCGKLDRQSQHGRAKSNTRDSSVSACKAESLTDCCADGSIDTGARWSKPREADGQTEPKNFEEFIHKVWGDGVAKHFAVPYNRKLWAVPLSEMETSWLGGRVPLPNLDEMIEGALHPSAKPVGPNARFGYPLRGGFQALMDGFLPLLQGELRTSTRVVRIVPTKRKIVLQDGTALDYEHMISTLPLPALIGMINKDEVPAAVRAAASHLRHVSVRCVNLGVARAHLSDKHWIYYPEDSVFHRIFLQGNASPHCNPPGGFGLTCEITYSPAKPLPCDGDALIDLCIADCVRVGMLRPEDKVIARNQLDMPYAYVVYDHARKRNVDLIRNWLSDLDIVLAGRYSEWEYYNSDHAFIAGKKAAEHVNALRTEAGMLETAEGA